MKNYPYLTIIVPIYQVEAYLRKCVESILIQNFKDFELLLIDDGSFDNSGSLCDEFAKKDSRIRVFHKKNGGVGSARNLGLKEARGVYVFFVDADDWLELDSLSVLNSNRIQNCELVQFGYSFIDVDNCILKTSVPNIEKRYSIKEYLSTNIFEHVLWVYFFKRDIIEKNELLFNTKVKYAEDWDFIIRYLSCIDFVFTLNKKIYSYFLRDGSACRSIFSADSLNHNLIVLESFLERDSKSINRKFINKQAIELLSYYISNIPKIEMTSSNKKKIISLYRNVYLKYALNNKLVFFHSIKFTLVFISLDLYVFIYNIYKRMINYLQK